MSRGLWIGVGIGILHHPLLVSAAQPSPAAPGSAAPTAVTPAEATVATKPAAAAAQPAPSFPILEYQVEGNTLLPVIDVERAVMPFLGESKTIKDVQSAQSQLEKAYHDRGYNTVFVSIPQQKVGDGVVRLAVTESPVGNLKIAGSRYHSLSAISDKVAQLNPDTVPNFKEVQKELGDVNHTADLKVTPVLKPSATPGHMDVELDVKDTLPLHAIAEVDNRYSANTTHSRVTGQIHYDNLFQSEQSWSFQYQIAPERPGDAKIWSTSYVIPLPDHFVWALYAIHSDSNVAAVGNLSVIGKGNIYGMRLIAPLPTSTPQFYHSFTAGLDYKDFKQNVVLEDSGQAIESPAKYPAFTTQYSATWLGSAWPEGMRAATASGRSSTNLDLNLSFLIRGLGTDWRQFADRRAGADPSCIIFHPSLTREQVIPGRWTLVGTVDGQLTGGPLINNEQFAAGGAETVRGYLEAERLGDEGVRGTIELRTPQLLNTHLAFVEQSYLFVFVDGARLHIIEPLPQQESEFTLESAGLGLRFKAAGLSASLVGAHVIKAGASTPAGLNRGLFSFSYTY